MKIFGYNYIFNSIINNSLGLYISKETLDKLDTLKIKNLRWFVLDKEYFDFKNIKKT